MIRALAMTPRLMLLDDERTQRFLRRVTDAGRL
jgi:hypothetical protein